MPVDMQLWGRPLRTSKDISQIRAIDKVSFVTFSEKAILRDARIAIVAFAS